MTIAAIPTKYRGIKYRSRLEARWAAFFHHFGWEFTYEPFDGHGYVPDFLIHGDNPLLVEVKPSVLLDDYTQHLEKIEAGLEGVWEKRLLIVGVSPLPTLPRSRQADFLPAGVMIEEYGWGYYLTDTDSFIAQWSNNPTDGVFTFNGQWQRSPSGACGKPWAEPYSVRRARVEIQDAWNKATNDVQWQAR